MKNAELFHHAHSIALQAITDRYNNAPSVDLFRSYSLKPQAKLDISNRTLTLSIILVSSSIVGNEAIHRELSRMLVNLKVRDLLPATLSAYVLNDDSLTVSKDDLKNQFNTQMAEIDSECHCDDIQINYEHRISYKTKSKEQEQALLNTLKSNLDAIKAHGTEQSNLVPAKISNALTFKLSNGDQEASCYLDASTKSVGFATRFDENGKADPCSSPTWDLWSEPRFDIKPMFKTQTLAGFKTLLKSVLLKGVSISDCKLHKHDCSHQSDANSAYKQITVKTNIGTYHNPLWVMISFKKTGKITVKNFIGQDVSELPQSVAVVNKIQSVRRELFRDNQSFASMFFKNTDDFRQEAFKEWVNPFQNNIDLYFR